MAFFKFQFELYKLEFEKDKFTKKFDVAAQRMVRQAARAWIRAVILKIGVYTGFAKGSIKFARGPFGMLGDYLNVSIPITPNRDYLRTGRPRFYYHWTGTKVPKTPERGGVLGRYNFPSSQMRYRFSFRSDVWHLIANDFYANAKIPNTPWHSLKAGRDAFRKYVKEHVTSLPKVSNHLKRTKISDRNWSNF